jgi:hypothetical protein
LVTADNWGNVVSCTLTIESTGGSGIVVPGRGFLLGTRWAAENGVIVDLSGFLDRPERVERALMR